MTQLLTRKTVILAKSEVTYGTDPTPTGAANALVVRNPQITPISSNTVSRDIVRDYLGNSEQLPTSEYATVSFEVEMAGSGAAGTAPKWGPLMLACGMAETISAGVSAAYQPVSASFGSIALYFNLNGRRHKLTGARGTFSIRMAIDGIPVFAFTFTGLYSIPADASESSVAYTGWQTPAVVTNTNTTALSIHGYSAGLMSELSIDVGNDIQFRPVVGASSTVILVNRSPSGSITLDADLVASWDPWTKIKAATLSSLSILHGTTAGNKVQIDAPKVQLGAPSIGDRMGIATEQFRLTLVPNAGNDELVITAK